MCPPLDFSDLPMALLLAVFNHASRHFLARTILNLFLFLVSENSDFESCCFSNNQYHHECGRLKQELLYTWTELRAANKKFRQARSPCYRGSVFLKNLGKSIVLLVLLYITAALALWGNENGIMFRKLF